MSLQVFYFIILNDKELIESLLLALMFSMFNKILSIIDNLYHSLYRRLIPKKSYENEITRRFHFVYYFNHSRTWNNTYWLGKNVQKCPLDLWIYQEIIYNLKPDKIIECGTYKG